MIASNKKNALRGLLGGICLLLGSSHAEALDVQLVTSPGGITAWLVEEHRLPIIDFGFGVSRGKQHEHEGQEGVASLMTYSLDEGAGDLDDRQFVAALEAIAADLSFNAGGRSITGSLRTLTEHRDEAFALLKMAINEPRFDESAIERIRGQLISQVKRGKQNPRSLVGELLFAHAFDGNPLARPSSGTVESLEKLTIKQVRGFYQAVFTREDLATVFVGDITPEELKPLLDDLFSGLPRRTTLQQVPVATFQNLGKTDVSVIDVPQSVIRWIMPGPARHDPDFFPAYVLNHILGGSTFGSRFFTEIREKRGLAYSVGTSLVPLRDIGVFFGAAGVSNDKVAETLNLMKTELERLAEEGPSEEEVDTAKGYLTGAFGLSFDTSRKIANQLLGQRLVGLPSEYANKRNERVAAVTLDAVRAAASRYLSSPMVTVVVGKPEGVQDDFPVAVQ